MAPNFAIRIDKTRIDTVEALYQACRYPDHPEIQAIIVDQPSPMTAKMKSKKYREFTRPDWNKKRLAIMRWCLQVKLAQNWSRFGAVLEKTGTRPIVEESLRDDFWGAKPNQDGTLVGLNVLGRLLMQLRDAYRKSDNDPLKCIAEIEIPNFHFLGKPIGSVCAIDTAPVPDQPYFPNRGF
jgi:ribA/ribD-fused uncharacterized protein